MSEFLSDIYQYIESFVRSWGYYAVFVLMFFESACIPIPSEVTMVFAGFMVSKGIMNLWWVTAVGTMANVAGSIATYYIGAKGGRPLMEKYGKYVLISRKKLDTADRWFRRYGEWAVFISRLLPGVRTFISLPAGVARMNVGRFLFYTTIGCVPWCFMLTYIGFKMGENWEVVLDYYHRFEYLILGLIVLAIIVLVVLWAYRRRKSKISNTVDM
jgi:membrane protein DedA with SNARE-associated domain